MDSAKKARFVAQGRKHFAKGGKVKALGKRKNFDEGGLALTGPSTAGVNNASNPNTGILGTIGGALGLNNNYQASGANIQTGTNVNQLNNAYQGAETALGQTGQLTNTLLPGAQTGVGYQNALEQQLYGMTQGQGPNPAQQELNQATQQNIQNQAMEAAGQRGASSNVGLLARQAAQQGAQAQQTEAGQAATLEAQQQIAAQQNLTGLAGTQVNQATGAVSGSNTAQQNEQSVLQGANSAANSANVGIQSNINSTNAGTAAGNQGIAGKVLGGVTSAVSGLTTDLGLAHGGVVGQGGEKEDHVKLAEMNATALAHGRAKFAMGGTPIIGNPLLGNQMIPTAQAAAGGGYTGMQAQSAPNIASAPAVAQPQQDDKNDPFQKAGAALGKSAGNALLSYFSPRAGADEMAGGAGDPSDAVSTETGLGYSPDVEFAAHGGKIPGPHKSCIANYFHGGPVKSMVSSGEIYLTPPQVREVVTKGTDPAKIGHKFKGSGKQKATVKGDSLKNDKIPADLEEGGVVIDRKNMGTAEKRKLFVHQAMTKKGN